MTAAGEAVAPTDERRHLFSGDPLYSESYYINFHDAHGTLAGFSRLAAHPSRPAGTQGQSIFGLHLPGGGVALIAADGALHEGDERIIRVDRHEQECLEPLKRWRLAFDGDVPVFNDPSGIPARYRAGAAPDRMCRITLDLEASAAHEAVRYPPYTKVTEGPPAPASAPMSFSRKVKRAVRRPGEVMSALRMRGGGHYEQAMTVRGTLAVDGNSSELVGRAQRDHSWGRRDWAPSERWRWLSAQGDDFAFSAMYLTIAGTHVINGYVWSGGRVSFVDAMRLETTFDASGLAGRSLTLELSAGGEQHVITGDVLANVPMPIDGAGFSTIYTVGLACYRVGDRIMYGPAEFLERLDP